MDKRLLPYVKSRNIYKNIFWKNYNQIWYFLLFYTVIYFLERNLKNFILDIKKILYLKIKRDPIIKLEKFIMQKSERWECFRARSISHLLYKKASRFEKLLGFVRSHFIDTRGSVSLSCAIKLHASRFCPSCRYIMSVSQWSFYEL